MELAPGITRKQSYVTRLQALKSERTSWDTAWREIAEVVQPRRARFFTSDTNKGTKDSATIINNTPAIASRVQASGMMAGVTSPARPWFRLATPDPELSEYGSVRSWLHTVEERIRQVLLRSNFYNAVHQMYSDLGDFGTAPLHIDEDDQTTIRCYVFPVGQYSLANGPRLNIDTCYREMSMTVGQLVRRFTREKCSLTVQNLYEQGKYDQWVPVTHLMEPNHEQKKVIGPDGKPFRSCWYETNGSEDKFLREAGYDEQPFVAPRWQVVGEDVYGVGPGFMALGDARALQVLERKKGQAVAKIVDPPMRAPSSLMNGKTSLMPGDVTFVDALSQGQTFTPAMEIRGEALQVIETILREHEGRIERAYYADVWLSMTMAERGEMTAREVSERHEEKMLQLGPVLERLQDECFDPAIDRTFKILLRRGELPLPPQELQGVDLRVEYTSIMAQAQKLLSTTGIERLSGFVGNLAAPQPQLLDKINFDKVIDEYGASLGVKPDLIRTDDEVKAIRQQREQQMQAAQQLQMAQMAAQGAKTLSETDTQGDNALTRMLPGLGGAAAAAAKA